MIAIRSISSCFQIPRAIGLSSSVLLEPRTTRASPYSSRAYVPPARRNTRRLRSSSSSKNVVVVQGPTLEMAKAMPLSYRDMENASLVALGAMGQQDACREMLIRHIMAVDDVSHNVASWRFLEIEDKNHENMFLLGLPFQIGVGACLAAGLVSIPLVFHLPTVEYFNEHYVTAEHPPLKELETILEVGGWSWNWMEPILGTCTFALMCVQYMRMHLNHLGFQPYTYRLKKKRGCRLVESFPQYDAGLLFAYSQSSTIYHTKKGI